MNKKNFKSFTKKLGLDTIDLEALKHFKFRRKKGGKKKLALLALAAVGAAVAWQVYKKKA